jgi:hypothetical protein
MRRLARHVFTLCSAVSLLLIASCSHGVDHSRAGDSKETHVIVSAVDFLSNYELADLAEVNFLRLDGARGVDREPMLRRVAALRKLETLEFYGCDLTGADEGSPVSRTAKTVYIVGLKPTQGVVRWLAKYPAGTTLLFGECDLRNVTLDLGSFEWVTVDNCELSCANVFQLLDRSIEVTFKECTISGGNEP